MTGSGGSIAHVDHSPCDKCGMQTGFEVRFQEGFDTRRMGQDVKDPDGHLRYECKHCGFWFFVYPMDHERAGERIA